MQQSDGFLLLWVFVCFSGTMLVQAGSLCRKCVKMEAQTMRGEPGGGGGGGGEDRRTIKTLKHGLCFHSNCEISLKIKIKVE